MSGSDARQDAHRTCWELLPWLVNGRIAAREADAVDEHLRSCEECRQELRLQQQLRDHIRSDNPLVLAPQASWLKLAAQLGGDIAESSTTVRPIGDESKPKMRQRIPRRWLAAAVLIQGVCLTGLLAAFGWKWYGELTEPRYRTLSTPAATTEEVVIRVVFAHDAPMQEVHELLRSLDAQFIAGPSEAGVYTVELGARAAQPSGDTLLRLRSNPFVVFAERAGGGAEAR